MGIYVFSRDVLYDVLDARAAPSTSAARSSRSALGTASRPPVPVPRLLGRRRHGDVVLRRQPDADAARRAVQLLPPDAGRSTRTPRFLPAARVHDCQIDEALIAEGAYLDNCEVESSVVGIRDVDPSRREGHAIDPARRRLLRGSTCTDLPLGIGKNAVLDRVIVDKNARIGDGARLVNERGIQDADGDGYYIRSGIIIVPKNGVVKPGTVV